MNELDQGRSGRSVWKSLLRGFEELLSKWRWGRRSPKPLAVCQSISLGDKRMLIVMRCEHERFLIGVTSNSMVLLAKLPGVEAGAAELGIAA